MSFKHGIGERIAGGRLFSDHTKESLCAALRSTGLALTEAWLTNDVRADRSGQHWLNAIATSTPGFGAATDAHRLRTVLGPKGFWPLCPVSVLFSADY